jgi:superfamily I DNA/RNA helicase
MYGRVFFANGKDKVTQQPIGLVLPSDASEDEKGLVVEAEGCKPTTLGSAADSRRTLIRGLADRDYHFIGTAEAAQAFSYRAHYATMDPAQITPTLAPIFSYTLPGEFKAVPIYEALYDQGAFIESLGQPVATLLGNIPKPRVLDETVHFGAALARFWPHFNQSLRRKHIMTYNEVLLALTSAKPGQIPISKLTAMRHLLVDEFQDISPILANWIKAMQRLLVQSNQTLPVSVMSIGDDWQSIYGWRGSSPQLFIDFKDYFPAHEACGEAVTLKFTDNFRSVKSVVDDAMRLLQMVRKKVTKDCIPVPPMKSGDHGVVLHEYGKAVKAPADVAREMAPLIEQRWQEALALNPATDEAVIVMTRRGAVRDALRRLLPATKYPKLQIYTYHQAKGLEADTAIMIEDCSPGRPFPFRNMVFEASGSYPNYSYDQSAIDEAYRLAYVGVTRGRRRVVWAVPEVDASTSAKVFKLQQSTLLLA